MQPIEAAIHHPVKVAVGVLLLVLFGLLSLFDVPIQLTPDVDKPIITVTTHWTGASPQEIEREIVDRQEEKLKSVSNVWKMTSKAVEGDATIRLEFPVSIDKNVAYRDVSDKLRQVTDYPSEVDQPVISVTDDDMSNIIAWFILRANDGRDISHLKTFVEEQIKPQLERAEGIAEVNVYGGREREVQVEIDPYRLAARGLTFSDVAEALRRQNSNVSAGTITEGKRDATYRTVGEYTRIVDVEETVIAHQAGGPVRVRDVARVIDGLKKEYAFVRSKGEFVIALPARRETGSNVIRAMQSLDERVEAVNREILVPSGLNLEVRKVYDETVYIWSAIRLVLQNLWAGGLLAVVVLWVFLRSVSATGIVALAIPITVIGTCLFVVLLGRSINVVMLAGMAFAVGMVIDNSIVVLENIYRHRSAGKNRMQAAFDGGQEVWGAVLASSLTTLIVFLPVLTVREEAGQLFQDIAVAISTAIALSLLVSILVIPPVAARYLTAAERSRGVNGEGDEIGEKPWAGARMVSGLVSRINRGLGRRVIVVVGLTFLATAGGYWIMPDAEYLPTGNQNLVFGAILTPPGYSIDEFKNMATIVEDGDPVDPKDGLRPSWSARTGSPEAQTLPAVSMAVGRRGAVRRAVVPPPIEDFFFVSFQGTAFMGCTSQVPTVVKPLEVFMNEVGRRLPGVFTFFSQSSLFGGGLGAGNTVEVEIRGDHYDAVVSAATAIRDRSRTAGFDQVNPDPANFDLGRPEVRLVADRVKAADLGLGVRELGFIIEACIDGAFVGEFNDHGEKIDLALTVAETHGATPADIGNLPICTPTGHVVPISSALDITRTTAPQQINHVEERRSVTLSIKSKPGIPLQETMREVDEGIIAPLRKEGLVPSNVATVLAGSADKLTQTRRSLIGDFRGLIRQPRLLGMSVGSTTTLLFVAAAVIVAAGGAIGGHRTALLVGAGAIVLLAIVLLACNPGLALAVMQSRTVVALLSTYLLMAALFESFLFPLVIMFTVPPAAVGGFAALRLIHEISLHDVTMPVQQLDVMTMLGFIILIGIVVNNGILIVHQALIFIRRDGLDPDSAIVKSVAVRTRPIFMTSFTSVCGMAPLVFMPGAGSELYRGLGSVVLGGLLCSTLLTLIIVPATLSLLFEVRERFTRTTRAAISAIRTLPLSEPVAVSASSDS